MAGTYHLNGVQAVSYTRIRYTAGNDYKRTERQRELIAKIVAKAKKADMKTLVDIMDNVFPMISTSLSKSDIVSLGMNMLSYQLGDTCGFPFEHRTSDLSGDSEVPVTLSWNVTRLHDYLFGIKDYEPSAGVHRKKPSPYVFCGKICCIFTSSNCGCCFKNHVTLSSFSILSIVQVEYNNVPPTFTY